MISLESIEREISELESRDASYATIERLSWLYICRDHIADTNTSIAAKSAGSAFLSECNGKPIDGLLRIFNDHMDCISAVCPKEYEAIMDRIKSL